MVMGITLNPLIIFDDVAISVLILPFRRHGGSLRSLQFLLAFHSIHTICLFHLLCKIYLDSFGCFCNNEVAFSATLLDDLLLLNRSSSVFCVLIVDPAHTLNQSPVCLSFIIIDSWEAFEVLCIKDHVISSDWHPPLQFKHVPHFVNIHVTFCRGCDNRNHSSLSAYDVELNQCLEN